MFARADAQEVEGLLNEPVRDFGILAEPEGIMVELAGKRNNR